MQGKIKDDTISRQAAIDSMCSACGHDCDKSKFVYNAPQDEQVIMCPEHYALSTLPSAQPEPVTNCHDLTAAIEAIERIFDRCEEIEAHLPEGDPDRVGYKMYPDWLTVWKYLHQVPSAQPDGEYISQQAVTESDLIDWYINSVDESEPVWTEEHIYELFNDFYLIPKESR